MEENNAKGVAAHTIAGAKEAIYQVTRYLIVSALQQLFMLVAHFLEPHFLDFCKNRA